jgi:predicted XRE-type DNA-binding protein
VKKTKPIRTKSAKDLAKFLDLDPEDAVEIEFRAKLNEKIIEVVEKEGLTHAEVAKLAKTSRTRVTAIMNHNTGDISSDLMLRILAALGYTAKVKFTKAS